MNTKKNSQFNTKNSENSLEIKKDEENTLPKILFPVPSKVSKHRLAIRTLLPSKPINFLTIASILPFVLGFNEFINQNQQLKKVLVQKNIPAFSIPTELINWDTFQYFPETKKNFLVELEKIDWSTNSLFLTKTETSPVFEKNYFIGSFTNSHNKNSEGCYLFHSDFQNFGLNRFYLSEHNKQPAVSFLHTFYLNLDELPLKLDNLNSYYNFPSIKNQQVESIDEQNSLSSTLPFSETFWENKKTGPQLFSQSEKPTPGDLLIQSEEIQNNQIPAVNKISPSKISHGIDTQFFVEKQISWFLQKIKNKTQNFLGSSFFEARNKNTFRANTLNSLDSGNNLPELILELENVLHEQDDYSLRRMSGYLYPDMNSKQVQGYLIHNLFSYFPKNLGLCETTQTSLKIIFPANPAFIKKFSFSNQKIPRKVPIKTGLVNLRDFDNKDVLYNSRAVFLDSQSGFDWQLNESSVIQDYLELSKPGEANHKNKKFLSKKIKHETSPNFSSSFSPSIKKSRFDLENYRFYLQNYFSPVNPLRESLRTYTTNELKQKVFNSRTIFFSREDIIIPFLTETEWKKIYKQNNTNHIFSPDYTVNDISLPVSKISLPYSNSNYARLNYSLNFTLDYLYSPENFPRNVFQKSPSIPFQKSFAFLDQIAEYSKNPRFLELNRTAHGEFFNDTFNQVSYKKVKSIFKKSQFGETALFNKPQFLEKSFSDNWEPLSFGSWLLVSQIGFAYLFVGFLKSIISDYLSELIAFIIDFGLAIGIFDENFKQEIELATGKRDRGFRIISETKKKFQDIAGINSLLPEVAEIVWFLRNSGKDFAESKNIPRGLLLLGPPGTGKTSLVQALGGEAKVPVLTLSGSSLVRPGESGALNLEILFQEARQLAPCIVFIDEIDSLAQKREGVMKNPMGGDEVLSVLQPGSGSLDFGQSTTKELRSQLSFFKKKESTLPASLLQNQYPGSFENVNANQLALEINQQIQAQEKSQRQQLTLLMQLLIELDGIHGRKGVIIIGATNRPELLDPAILRPGRFDKIIELGLPNYKKRLEIFKLYGEIFGYHPNISWEYLAKRTVGFTAADLASIMNQSSLKVILNNKKLEHTLETIEHGINRITTYEIETSTKKISSVFVTRVAYYQAGKVLLSTILQHHPPTLICYLYQRRQNRRSLQILANLQKYFFQFARRCEIEHRIVGYYGGKAAEILFLENCPENISSFGLEDLTFAFVLICFTVEKWYIYSKSTLISQLTQIILNKNSQELSFEKIQLFKELASAMELAPDLLYSNQTDLPSYPFLQNFFSSAWWQRHISQLFEFVDRDFADWYRLYLPNPEETVLNIDWSPPDEFFHKNLMNKKINKNSSITWNDLQNIARDYQVHSFVLQSFNKALSLVDENREFLDKLVVELLKREVLRESEIEQLASLFLPPKILESSSRPEVSSVRLVHNSFGQKSRRKIKNWIDFQDFEN